MRFFILTLFVSSFLFAQDSKTNPKELKVAYFASGCFWCVEAIYESVPGVKEAISGYAGSDSKNPTYNTIRKTGHAETVAVYYDPNTISYADLIDVYYLSQNPTTYGQNPDFGKNYRSIIFYSDADEKKIAQTKFDFVNKILDGKVVTEITELDQFYPAEEYHQDYEKKHPENSYIKNVSIPRLERFKEKYFEE